MSLSNRKELTFGGLNLKNVFLAIALLFSVFAAPAFALPNWDAECTSSEIPNSMDAGETTQFLIQIKNIGSENWDTREVTLKSRQGRTWGLTSENLKLGINETVKKGESQDFIFTVTAPQNGDYAAVWQMHRTVKDEFFGDICGDLKVTVGDNGNNGGNNGGSNTAPNISSIQDFEFSQNSGTHSNIVDLFDQVQDNEDNESELSFSLTQTNSGAINCFISGDRYVSCGSPAGYQAFNQVTVRATDTGGLTDTETFTIEITGDDDGFNDPPRFTNIRDIDVPENSDRDTTLLDLHPYASDNEDTDSELRFNVDDQSRTDIISCFISSNRYIACNAPTEGRTGTSTITVTVMDTEGEIDEESVNVIVFRDNDDNDNDNDNSDAPDISGIPNETIIENSGDEDELIDLFDYASDDEDTESELDYRIISQSNTSLINCRIEDDRYVSCDAPREDRTGESTITVRVEDSDNLTDTDSFNIRVVSEGSGICSDVRVQTETIHMDELDTENVSFEITNDSDEDFVVNIVDISENSTYITVSNVDAPDTIDAGDSADVTFDLRSLSISGDKEATVTIEIRGEFDSGDSCGFGDITTRSFRVVINDGASGSSNSVCSDISLDVSDITVNENSKTTKTFTITNDNDRSFTIDSIKSVEDSSDVTIGIVKRRSSVGSEDSEQFDLTINADPVSSTKNVDVELRVSGRFSGGRTCSSTSITDNFNLKIKDSADTSGNAVTPQPRPPVDNAFVSAVVQAPAEITGTGKITLLNNGDDLTNVTVTALNTQGVKFTPVSKLLWRAGETLQMDVNTGTFDGNVSATIRLSSDEGSKSIPVQFKAKRVDSITTGLVNFATTAGIAIGLIILVVLAIAGILSIVNKK